MADPSWKMTPFPVSTLTRLQAEVARIVQPVNGEVRLHPDLQSAALR
jgi:hypothetical protein